MNAMPPLNTFVMKKSIFVVEDNASIREMLEFLLKEEEFEVVSCPNSQAFWQAIQMQLPDMVVLDVMLPDGNGVDICTQLKGNVKTHNIPVMMMSANNQLNKIKSKCGAEDYINKPFDLNDFVERVEHYLVN